jgi:hypothetical protein
MEFGGVGINAPYLNVVKNLILANADRENISLKQSFENIRDQAYSDKRSGITIDQAYFEERARMEGSQSKVAIPKEPAEDPSNSDVDLCGFPVPKRHQESQPEEEFEEESRREEEDDYRNDIPF